MEEKTKVQLDFEKYLESIGGLENGYFTDRPPITDAYYFEVSDGWIPLIQELIEKAVAAGWDKQICQVKEKFGGLRFYINSSNDEVFNIISEYESKSYHVCEICGQRGEIRKGGWWKTYCELHDEENQERIKRKNVNNI